MAENPHDDKADNQVGRRRVSEVTARKVLARIIRVLVKLATCAVGGAIAGQLIMIAFGSGSNPIFYESDTVVIYCAGPL